LNSFYGLSGDLQEKNKSREDTMRLFIISVLFLLPALSHATGGFRVTIRGLDPGKGRIFIKLIASAKDFESADGTALRAEIHPVPASDTASIAFAGIPAGMYAVKVFQDSNGNGKLDTDILGRPREPFGFSNDAMGRMGPPSFAAAAFRYAGGDHTAVITLKKL
jgi:uncharacterized protein (DUF2141 family)